MEYRYIHVNSLLTKITKKDKLFYGNYTVDPYKNCEFGCSYCDSSLEKTVFIKYNAPDILEKELKSADIGTIVLGSVNDPYQSIEKETGLTREILKVIKKHDFSCHVLTKSDLVRRDVDILSEIPNCRVTISLISLNKNVVSIFEKNVPRVEKRLDTVYKLNEKGVTAGIALIPILPYIVEEEIEGIFEKAKKHKAKYLLYEYLELKGDQKTYFLGFLKKFREDLIKKYEELYRESIKPDSKYILDINNKMDWLSKKYEMKTRVNTD